jgi:S-formylglutathione hydrolase FrmB
LTDYAGQHEMIIVAVEGENGWYTDGAANPNDRYESYIIEELIPEVDKKYRTNKSRSGRAIAGLSMGGYGSLKFGLKYPDKFAFAGSMSGALGAASLSGREVSIIGGVIKSSIERAFGAEADTETRKANDIFKIIREMPDEQKDKLPFLYLDCGTEDFLYANNREFSELLRQKRVRHEFRQLPGNHDWGYWNKQIQEILRLGERFLTAGTK